MFFLNLSLGQFLVLFGSMSAIAVALYLLDRSRRRQTVSTLRFWVAAEQPTVILRRKRIQQPFSLLLQILSMALLLLAIAQLRLGTRGGLPHDHVLILETSAWMAARTAGPKLANGELPTLMDEARERARAYVRAVPSGDRVMLVRADALTSPVTGFEPSRKKLAEAIAGSRPGSTALNLDQALAFARHVQTLAAGSAGEIVFVGSGRISERETLASSREPVRNLRVLQVTDAIDNCGLRKVGLRKSTADADLWDIYVSARNYGSAARAVTLTLHFGGAPVGSRRLLLPPGSEREATFEYRTRAAGLLEARLLTHDAFPDDDRAVIELPPQKALTVTVYSDEPDLLRPVLAAHPRVNAIFRGTAAYRPGSDTGLLVLDRFRPAKRPTVDSIWIDPPSDGSPIPVRAKAVNVQFTRWLHDHPLGAGLRTRDLRLESASIFEASPGDIKVAETENGPVIVARPGKPKIAVLGFHPSLSTMRYELATPLLFANLLRWMAPETFRRWELSGGSVGTVKLKLDPDVGPADVRVIKEDGNPLPFTIRDRSLDFFVGTPGTVRVIAADREYVQSLTLPELWDSKWQAPADASHGIPTFRRLTASSRDIWQWLAILGGVGLFAEWILFGRLSRGLARFRKPLFFMRARVKKAS